MSKVIITIEELEDGKVSFEIESEKPYPEKIEDYNKPQRIALDFLGYINEAQQKGDENVV